MILAIDTSCLFFQLVAMSEEASYVKVKLIREMKTFQPGKPTWLAVQLKIKKGWYISWNKPGDIGIPIQVEWTLPQGFERGPLQWPPPKEFSFGDKIGFGYQDEAVLLFQLIPPKQINSSNKNEIEANVMWIVCSSAFCLPASEQLSLSVVASPETPQTQPEYIPLFQKAFAIISDESGEKL